MTAEDNKSRAIGIGDAKKLLITYSRWKMLWERAVGKQNLILPLAYIKGPSAAFTRARGEAVIGLVDGSVSVKISGLPARESFDVWMIGYRQFSQGPRPDKNRVNLGTLKSEESMARLEAQAADKIPPGCEIDYMVVARTGHDPAKAGLLFGAPSLFQKIYYSENRGQLAMLGGGKKLADSTSMGSAFYSAVRRLSVPAPAYADYEADYEGGNEGRILTRFQTLIDRGEQIFFHEKFKGNGRTCGSCHPATNNFTLDPAYIATLPPRDPLFVAEYDPKLAGLENPELMHKYALILENMDGFEDPTHKYVMRGVPHLLGISQSIRSDPNRPYDYPVQRTGWSGDGAPVEYPSTVWLPDGTPLYGVPDTGSLRHFATGAVVQHFTKSLNRVAGVDFRLPTDNELDALEAFQLSLGRHEEIDLESMHFKSEVAELGKEIFLNKTFDNPRAGKCQRCHGNAGANSTSTFFNANRDTGVESLEDQPAKLTDPAVPIDGGFGRDPNLHGGFGDGTFNIASLIEAADTPPFFHNNSVNTLEGAVAFYNDDVFNDSPSGITHQGLVNLESTQVQAVAALLRVLNALDNIRSSDSYESRVKCESLRRGKKLLDIAISETEDAIEVLDAGVFLYPDAVQLLKKARELEDQANTALTIYRRNTLIDKAIEIKRAASELMVSYY
ncbi:MAG: hypothetical protein AB1847_00465 [bacterium]